MVTTARAAALQSSGLNVSQGPTGTSVGTAPSSSTAPASSTSTQSTQPSTGIGSTAETNALLGGTYFDEKTGAPVKPFTAADAQANAANYQSAPAVVTSGAAQDHVNQINDFRSTVKQGMASQAANNAAVSQTPNIPGYAVVTGGQKPTNPGTFSFDVAGKTYYATPDGTQTTQSDLQKALAAYGATNDSDAPTASTDTTSTNPHDQLAAESASYQSQTAQVMSDTEQAYETYKSAVSQITSGVFPLSPSQQALVDSTNNAFNAMLGDANLKAAAISSETGGFSNKVTSMLGVMSNIESQQAAAIAKLDQGFQDENYKLIKDSYDEFTSLEDKKTAQLDSLHKDVVDQLNTAVSEQEKVQDNIDTIAENAAKNGADAKTIAAIRGSADVGAAIGNAGDYLQTGTGQIGDYLMYKRDAESKGLTPQDYQTWKAADDAQTAKQKYAEAYGAEAGKNAADNASGDGSGNNYGNAKVQNALEQQYRAVLEKEFSARSGTYGLNDSKVSQANKLAVLFNQAYDPKTGDYNLNAQQYGELAEGLASLISGSPGGASDSDVAMLKAATAKGDWNKVYTYVTGNTANGNTQDVIKSLAGSVEREAQQAAADRETDEQKIKGLAPTGLDPARADALTKAQSIPYTGIQGVAKNSVNDWVKSNPAEAKAMNIPALYSIPGATDEMIWQYIQANG